MLLLSDMKMNNKQLERLGYWVLAGFVILAGVYFFNSVSNIGTVKQPSEVSLEDNVRGGEEAEVVLVEYADFQCPACASYEPLLKAVLKNHEKDVQFVFRHFPLTQTHKNALISAKFAEAAGIQGKFWEMHDSIFEHQVEWSESLNAKEILIGLAKEIGLDIVKLETDLTNKTIEDKIFAQAKEGVDIGVQGTPTFFINGVRVENNPRSIEEFEKLITEAKQGAQVSR